ncbi:MAG: ATP-binding cassette domain-containing protein [Bdellovibrionota bacterium]
MNHVIETHGLTRAYETYVKPEGLLNSVKGFWNRKVESKVALHPTELSIEGGQIVGLVGGNGAGKTTLLKLLSGLIYPSGGEAKVLGFSPSERKSDYLRQISILLGQKNQLWWDIPPADSYDLLARIYDVDRTVAKKRVAELADILQCTELLNVQLRRLSLGERMKMEIIGSLLHRPRVLFLDEPTIGLDIVAQTTIREFLADYVQREKPTVILTSHYMDDISKLADRLLLISQGRIVYDGSVDSFMANSEKRQRLTMKFVTPPAQDLVIAPDVSVVAGALSLDVELAVKDIAPAIQRVMTMTAVEDLKIQEADFEDVIRGFLEKESRLRQTRSSLATRV